MLWPNRHFRKRTSPRRVVSRGGNPDRSRSAAESSRRRRAGFRLALRLAGMTMKPDLLDSLTTLAVLQPNCQIAYLALALQLENSGFVGIQSTHTGPQAFEVLNRHTTHGVNHVAGKQLFLTWKSRGDTRRYQDAFVFSQGRKLLGSLGVQREAENSEPLDAILLDANVCAEALGVWISGRDGHFDLEFVDSSQHFQRDSFTNGVTVDIHLQLAGVLHHFAVKRQD